MLIILARSLLFLLPLTFSWFPHVLLTVFSVLYLLINRMQDPCPGVETAGKALEGLEPLRQADPDVRCSFLQFLSTATMRYWPRSTFHAIRPMLFLCPHPSPKIPHMSTVQYLSINRSLDPVSRIRQLARLSRIPANENYLSVCPGRAFLTSATALASSDKLSLDRRSDLLDMARLSDHRRLHEVRPHVRSTVLD